jgi:hypothetical protein
MMKSLLALNALNFFMADVRDGLGPFLGVDTRRWSAFSARKIRRPGDPTATNGIWDRMQIMHSSPSRKLDEAARPPDAAGACI